MKEKKLLPNDVSLEMSFVDSEFQNIESEIVARNIVFIQKKMNPNFWSPFSFEDYQRHCTHNVNQYIEEGVLEVFVSGGKPVPRTSTYINAGYLSKEGDKYLVTERFLNFLSKQIEKNKIQ